MLQLTELQAERNDWVAENFPDDSLIDSLLGAIEELGEIAHHLLKRKQGIRGSDEYHTEQIRDGVADLVIFGAGIASHEGFDYGVAVQETWNQVKQRDWQKDKEKGGTA